MIVLGSVIVVFLAVNDRSTFVGVIVFLNGWYILFTLFQIGLRSSVRISIGEQSVKLEEAIVKSLPRFGDLVLLWSFGTISAFSWVIYAGFSETYVAFLTALSIPLNCVALATVAYWLTKQEKKHRLSEKTCEKALEIREDLMRDKYRLYATVFFLGIPIVAAAGSFSALVFWTGLISGLIILSFNEEFRKRVQRKRAGVYASLLTAYLGLAIFTILGAAGYGLPQLGTLLTQIGLFFVVLLAIYWAAVFRLKRRWKWK